MLRAIEFDKEEFKSIDDCKRWLRSSTMSYIVDQKGFGLRTRKTSVFLTWEKRSVWYYITPSLWQETHLKVVRPVRGVCGLVSESEDTFFSAHNIPELLPSTVKKMEEKEKKKEEARKKANEAKENKKRKRLEEREAREKLKKSAPEKEKEKEKKEKEKETDDEFRASIEKDPFFG